VIAWNGNNRDSAYPVTEFIKESRYVVKLIFPPRKGEISREEYDIRGPQLFHRWVAQILPQLGLYRRPVGIVETSADMQIREVKPCESLRLFVHDMPF